MPSYPLNTTVQLLHDVPLSPNSGNSIRFASASARESYFAGKVFNSYAEIQYMRDDGRYRLNMNYDEALANCNYMRYRNQSTGRWYYCYITSISYANTNVCWIDFKIDTYMTFQFDLVWKDCFIERECVSDDTPGKHTVPENLETGELQITEQPLAWPGVSLDNIQMVPCLFVSAPYRANEYSPLYDYNMSINGVPQTTALWAPFPFTDETGSTASQMDALNDYLNILEKQGRIDAIIFAVAMPKMFFDYDLCTPHPVNSGDYSAGSYIEWKQSYLTVQAEFTINAILSAGYVGINNKLYTYPYNYYILSNNQGNTVPMYYEYMEDAPGGVSGKTKRLAFALKLAPTPDETLYCQPTNYLGGDKFSSGLAIENFPTIAVASNAFANWFGGHKLSILNTALSDTIGIAVNAAAGNPQGAINSVSNITSLMATMLDKQRVPYQVTGSTGNTANMGGQKFSFSLLHAVARREMLIKIDRYFSMYGYKVNRLGTPEFGTRQYWNFYKIPICNVYADIPSEYLEDIRTQFQNGITLWNTTDVGNYHDGSNPIV